MVRLRIYKSGDKYWYLNNLLHRANGPAVIWNSVNYEWFWYDHEVTEYEHMMLVAQEQSNGQITHK